LKKVNLQLLHHILHTYLIEMSTSGGTEEYSDQLQKSNGDDNHTIDNIGDSISRSAQSHPELGKGTLINFNLPRSCHTPF